MQYLLSDAVSVTLPAATPTVAFTRAGGLAREYRRLDITLKNTGSQNVTACTFRTGVRANLANDSTRAAAIVSALVAGATYSLTLTDEDVPESLEISLTSANGTTVVVDVAALARS